MGQEQGDKNNEEPDDDIAQRRRRAAHHMVAGNEPVENLETFTIVPGDESVMMSAIYTRDVLIASTGTVLLLMSRIPATIW